MARTRSSERSRCPPGADTRRPARLRTEASHAVERGGRPAGQCGRLVAQALCVRAQLVPRRRRQPASRLRVARLGVGQERRHASGQRVGRRRHVRAPPLARRHRDGVPALGRRDAGPGRDDVGHGLVSRVPDAGEDRLGGRGDGAGHDLGLEGGQVRSRSAAAHQGDDVAVAAAQEAQGPGDGRRRVRPLHGAPGRRRRGSRSPTRSGGRGSRCSPRCPGLATSPMCMVTSGTGRAALARSRPSVSSLRSSAARWAAIRPRIAVTSISARTRLSSPLAR